ncbi:MAG: hypothetical protein CMK07_13375 [Ponticaulis sp.]|nr:hypothetical protein [Ponticaulis sp.]
MAKFHWADKINGNLGDFLDQVIVGLGIAIGFVIWSLAAPIWIAAIIGLLLACGLPLFLHFRFPGLYMTAGEKDEEFEQRRRFGRKR